MPLVYQQDINDECRLGVWHIREAEDFFLQKVAPIRQISHPHKRIQHLAGRYLLLELFPDFPIDLVMLADTRRPFLPGDPFHFSVSHGGDFAAALLSRKFRAGVDVELIKPRILSLQHKFLSNHESQLLDQWPCSRIQALTMAWSMKESMYKWNAGSGIDFRQHLLLKELHHTNGYYKADTVLMKDAPRHLPLHGLLFPEFALTWALTNG